MITLKSLTLSNIGRFVEEQTIDFTTLGSLVQVDGQNSNTGGSSGSGKSTIFKALEFLLGLNDVSNGILQSRLTKDPMSVTGLFDLDGQPLKIERNKKLLIDLNGEVTTGSSKLTEEKLDQIIGMPRDLFRKILHKRQGEGGFFLNLGPSETHKFLTDCLGLQKEQEKILVLDTKMAGLTKIEISLKSSIESNRMGLEATKSAILSLGQPPVLEIDPEAVAAAKTRHTEANVAHLWLKTTHKTEMEELEKSRPKVAATPFDRAGIEYLESEVSRFLAEVSGFEKAELNRQSIVKSKISDFEVLSNKLGNSELNRQSEVRSKISSNKTDVTRASYVLRDGNKAKEEAITLAESLKKVRASICPTCEQQWITDAAKATETQILQKLQEYKKLVVAGIEADKKIKTLEEDRKVLDLEVQPKPIPELENINVQLTKLKLELWPQIDPAKTELKSKIDSINKDLSNLRKEERDHQLNENAKMQLVVDNFAQKQAALRQSHEIALKPLQDEINKAISEYETMSHKLRSFEESKKRFEQSLGKLNLQSSSYELELSTKSLELVQIQEEIELATEAKKAIKSYLSCSFEDALNSIGDTATKFIRNVPNMQNGTIQFEGLKETKDGKVKEEVTCLISMDGEIGIPVKSLSGGERSSTDLAIDLAVMEFIQETAGKGINLLILDEPFTGLDSTNISSIVDLLRESGINKQILIVDHNPLIQQTFESKITVIRDGLTSKIVQQ